MAITMYQSDRNTVSPANDASLYSGLVNDTNGTLNRGSQFAVTVNGLVATVGTGQAVIQGRLVEITQSETLTLPANSNGKIAIAVDLTKTNDVSGTAGIPTYQVDVKQAYLVAVTEKLTQDDLNNGGFLYELPIASFTSTTTSAKTTVIKSVFNDTGWIDAELVNGTHTNGGTGFAQYRVKNGMMIINFYNLNCSKSTNGNQILVIPYALRPSSPHSQVFAASNLNINKGKSWPVSVTVQSQSTGSVMYGTWTPTSEFNSLTGATGTIIYPIN
ncbi:MULTISPECIES: hypothetical protein [Leuconostoc]|uniref:hypothetical protein n=1 Tax=Leuconostoc TaxID=1243 RepID=UPI0009B6634C|nr:hypothetical protein [Leuconostoc sp. BM2]OQJ73179.1 hypothetical protein BMS80_06650 [Leuconostoc pseudomesenteroides]ORI51448.1 hypothetical protein BMS85_07810 [Leuconostoc pseudomesenteroides]ORI58199.1 hypothetical protein BMS88_07500 [Leuconostoc pseudomesenteroides]ORI73746.1 hypothetical protein BMS65_06915 [Leuconostoc pseudomesenteroides]ORM43006.1 hypothetical protein BMG01_06915 [Leuconostoc sp. BM2]